MFTFAILLGFVIPSIIPANDDKWQPLAPGMDVQILNARIPGSDGDSKITVVRIDPKLWELVFIGISQTGETSGKTAREWCKSYKLTAAINAGMFDTNNKTHVGIP
jgi:exopolysaccharide biosynthesis protein